MKINWYKVALPTYEGSVEELLFLVKKRRVSPLELEIAKITASYLEWLHLQQEIELVYQSNLLVFLSELLLIKSGVCLPRPQAKEEEEKGGSLITYLSEYKEYKDVSFWIEERFREQETKIPISGKYDDIIEEEIEVSIFDLFSSLKDMLDKRKESPVYELVIDEPRLEDSIERIKKRLIEIKKIEFTVLLDVRNRLELIVTFLAILELIRLRFLKAIQHRAFSSIWLIKK